ncbi:MAG: FemAB family PEP-CTERM system-associated protein [Burkholderiales bacterium]|nr:FemAB family PEP-CTERM system-associated protein [Burkholderiales bacterium]
MSAVVAHVDRANMTHPVAVRTLQAADRARWDEFVLQCPGATFFHRVGWQHVIERAFGHRTHYLLAECDGAIEGVLPLAEVKSFLFGHSLASLPFCVYGGVAARTQRARAALDAAAVRLAESLQVGHLEYRDIERRHPDWATKDLYVTFRKALDPDPERNLAAIPRKQRAMVRKGIKAGLGAHVDSDTSRFFAAYSDSVHRLGTPVFARRYFDILLDVFGRDVEILTVTLQDETVASVLSFYFRDEVLPYYGGGTRLARDVAGNDFMYWEVMRRACERGVRIFDYGRSKRGTGSFDFKKNWGFEPQPLNYAYRLVRSDAVPEHNPLNPKYRLFISMWQRLPLSLANLIGPYVVKNIG